MDIHGVYKPRNIRFGGPTVPIAAWKHAPWACLNWERTPTNTRNDLSENHRPRLEVETVLGTPWNFWVDQSGFQFCFFNIIYIWFAWDLHRIHMGFSRLVDNSIIPFEFSAIIPIGIHLIIKSQLYQTWCRIIHFTENHEWRPSYGTLAPIPIIFQKQFCSWTSIIHFFGRGGAKGNTPDTGWGPQDS